MMAVTIRQSLDRGYVAVIVTEDTDRPPYQAPAIPRDDHAANCPCPDCVMLRARQQRERLV